MMMNDGQTQGVNRDQTSSLDTQRRLAVVGSRTHHCGQATMSSALHRIRVETSPAGLALRHLRRLVFCSWPCYPSTFLRSLCSIPITGLLRSYGRSDSCQPGSSALSCLNSGSCHWQVSLLHVTGFPIPLSPTTHQSPNAALSRYPSARWVSLTRSRLRQSLAGSPKLIGRNEFVILRMDRSPPAAPHPASRRRSCSRLQAGERMPEEDLHLPDQCARRRTSAGVSPAFSN